MSLCVWLSLCKAAALVVLVLPVVGIKRTALPSVGGSCIARGAKKFLLQRRGQVRWLSLVFGSLAGIAELLAPPPQTHTDAQTQRHRPPVPSRCEGCMGDREAEA